MAPKRGHFALGNRASVVMVIFPRIPLISCGFLWCASGSVAIFWHCREWLHSNRLPSSGEFFALIDDPPVELHGQISCEYDAEPSRGTPSAQRAKPTRRCCRGSPDFLPVPA